MNFSGKIQISILSFVTSESWCSILRFKEFDNLSVEKKTNSTALGFESRSFDCRSTALTTELHRRPTSPSSWEYLLISPSGSAFIIAIKTSLLHDSD